MQSMDGEAPTFELQGVSPEGEIRSYSLDELTENSALVLGAYVFDFSPVCINQMCDVSEMNWMTFQQNVNVVGISTDGPYSHQKFIEEKGISYPLLCDVTGEVMQSYDLTYPEKDGFKRLPKRSVLLIDSDQQIRYRWTAADNWDDWSSNPLEEIQQILEEMDSAGG